jgi:hypothetical protein
MNEKEIIERKIFLKRQLIELTERDIKELEELLKEDDAHVQTEPTI